MFICGIILGSFLAFILAGACPDLHEEIVEYFTYSKKPSTNKKKMNETET